MDSINYLEWIGYIGSVTIAISLTMTSMVKLRWLNFIGALIFTVYGFAIHALPVALVNSFITIIDVYYLYKMYTTKDYFKLMETNSNDDYLKSFLLFYKTNIKRDVPNFEKVEKNSISILILRNMNIAGVFVGHQEEDTLYIDLDFATPPYQDFKTGRFLLIKNLHLFKEKGIKEIVVKPTTKSLRQYYSKMGFSETEELFVKKI